MLDALVCACVEEPPLQTPPASPTIGSGYIVGPSPTGVWSQFAHHIASFTAGGWRYIAPTAGLRALIRTSGAMAIFRGTAWEIGIVAATKLVVGDQQVVGARGAAVPNPAGGTVIDIQARQAITDLLSRLRTHGLIA